MNSKTNFSPYILPGIIILISAIVRFWGINSFSLSNDELSTVIRLNYSDFTSLIAEGIVATDPHPGGVQVFLYFWTKVFGLNPFALRLPFVLSSTLALLFIFLTFKDWFGRQTALISMGVFALMEFSFILGQLARPYAIGLLTVWIFTWAWTKIIFHKSKKPLHLIAFIVGGTLSCYTHYFAALTVGIIGMAGIYPSIKRKVLKLYLLLSSTAVLLFTPHLGITMLQLGRGSLTSWITKADQTFFFEHIFYLLNESYLLSALTFLFVIMGVFLISRKVVMRTKFALFSFFFFIIPIAVGYLYSEFFGSVLMDRVLFFSSPFFFGLVFSHLPEFDKNKFYGLLGLMLFATLYSSIFERQFFNRMYTENFKALAADMHDHGYDKSSDNTMLIGNFNSTQYINYYLDSPVDFTLSSLDNDSLLGNYQQLLRKHYPNNVALYWACKYQPIAAIEYAKYLYGPASDEEMYYNSGYWQFRNTEAKRETLMHEILALNDSMNADKEYYEILKVPVESLKERPVLNVRLNFTAANASDIHLVFSQTSKDGEMIFWRGHSLGNYSDNIAGEIFQSLKIDEESDESDILSIYLWNPRKNKIIFSDLVLSSFGDSRYDQLY